MANINETLAEIDKAEWDLKAIAHEDGGLYSHAKWSVDELKASAYPALRDEIRRLQAALSAKEAEIERLRKEMAFRPFMPAEEKQRPPKLKYSNGSNN